MHTPICIPPDNNELLSVNYNRLSWDEFLIKVMGLYIEERDIFEQIRSFIGTAEPISSNSSRVEPGLRRRDELELLIEKRDSILESLVILCICFCVVKFWPKYRYNNNLEFSFLDLLIFFTTINFLYYYYSPYVKFWEIIERIPSLA